MPISDWTYKSSEDTQIKQADIILDLRGIANDDEIVFFDTCRLHKYFYMLIKLPHYLLSAFALASGPVGVFLLECLLGCGTPSPAENSGSLPIDMKSVKLK